MERNRGEDVCWREEVEEKLKRLHSLLFGADSALERADFTSAQILGLRLLGFLDSVSQNALDHELAFIHPIRTEILSKIDSARRSLAPESDRQAFEQARRAGGNVFIKRGDINAEKVMQSKYFRSFLHKSKGSVPDRLIPDVSIDANSSGLQSLGISEGHQMSQSSQLDGMNAKLNFKASKVLTQTKLTSLYGSRPSKPSNTPYKKLLNYDDHGLEECVVVEKANSNNSNYLKGHGTSFMSQVEEEEKSYGNSLRAKRQHMEIMSPKHDIAKSPSSNEEANADNSGNGFVTARVKLEMDAKQRHGLLRSPSASVSPQSDNGSLGNLRNYGVRSGGISRRGLRGNFIPPIRSNGTSTGNLTTRISGKCDDALEDSTKRCLEMLCGPDGELPEKLRNLEPRLIEHVSNEIMDRDPNVRWDDIAGLEHAKKCVTEMVIWPLLRPDIFKGCRSPGRGLLLFGPPGTGKTMIGKAIAGEAKATFFYISASSLTSKWIGEGEKLVRALFGVASCRQPAVIFVDEIDSLLSQRKSEGEHESSRRLKTQFLIEMEGFDSGNEQILLIGATNRPQELDEAARRRLTKRLYIPLPSSEARAWIIRNLLEKDGLFKLSEDDTVTICRLTAGYSGSDMKNLVKDASMGPLREALRQGVEITKLRKEDMRPVTLQVGLGRLVHSIG
ncbi:ATPase family AAA domain-containing protein FIGL1 isoform X2 [Magnolia sinica]|uniref:ATPase family AAA domain-containing protein FIGL1 isoform X2 n=1 Tax=Magnolia sinica TaxID=86752 RepID=UPI0026584079|nr:ATPase family AAA domain-containing protein FIGL1 isoform X2 [Magnolia sinica]